MSKTVGFRVDKDEEKILNRFKQALSRKYGKIHGVFSRTIVELIESYVTAPSTPRTHTKSLKRPQRFTRFHHVLARIYFALPNGGKFPLKQVNSLIEDFGGGDSRTINHYRITLLDWGLVVGVGKETTQSGRYVDLYQRGKCPDWLGELKEESP